MLLPFASGYYLREYWVKQTDTHQPSINQEEYTKLKENVYNDTPILVKIQNTVVPVVGSKSVPNNTLQLNLERDISGRNPERKQVLMPKPSVVENMYMSR